MKGDEALVLAKGYVDDSLDGLGAVKGSPCTIKQISEIDGGHRITFEWIGTSGASETSSIDVKNGDPGKDGENGQPGKDGENGLPGRDGVDGKDGKNGINGKDGVDGKDGQPGKDGYSPTLRVEDVSGGHKVTVTDIDGSSSFIVKDGEPFTYDKFTTDQLESLKGADGVSPTVTITEATGMHTVSFTDKEGVKSFVVKDGSALDVENYYTKDEVNSALTGKANTSDIPTVPTNISELTNDENYIKNTVDNLIHYYNKTDTYTKTEVNSLISNIQKLTSKIVDELPTEDIDTSVIYLIKQGDTSAYMQYMYIDSAWAELGSTQVDLSNMYSKSEVDAKLLEKANKSEIPNVPTAVSAFTNDAGYITEYVETDPTVPAWAKADTKPTYTAAEVHALPDDVEVQVFTNKSTLDNITADNISSWNNAVANTHEHENKTVIDKFTESSDGTVLYNGEQIASGNLWHGTKEEYDALSEKDIDTTYVVTDEEDTVASALIDDSATAATDKTWSAKKISCSTIPYVLIDVTKDIDLNEYVETGYYTPNKSFSTGWFTYSILNAPTNGWLPAGGFALEVKTFDNTGSAKWFTQVLYSYVGTDNNSAPIYTRTFFYDGSKVTFSPWKRMADIDDSNVSSEEAWSSKKINDTFVSKNSKKMSKSAPSSEGSTTFTFDISTLALSHGYYHFKCYVLGNGNVSYFAEGGIGQYNGEYNISIAYKSSKITDVSINDTTITITTAANYYVAGISIQSVDDWMIS